MFWSRKKSPAAFTEVKVAASELKFLGEPKGSGLLVLKEALSAVLMQEGNTKSAYLSRVRYPNEDRVRAAVVIEGTKPAEQMASVIAQACQAIVAIDLIFFEHLSSEVTLELKQSLSPFYVASDA
jgi:hypothetical protein